MVVYNRWVRGRSADYDEEGWRRRIGGDVEWTRVQVVSRSKFESSGVSSSVCKLF
ncbi:hypothetical protein YC2023_078507 [Brassica napus]